jgi:hypothetical protein
VTIQVSDDGVGMNPDQIDGLFELGEIKRLPGPGVSRVRALDWSCAKNSWMFRTANYR